jgi:radical S-adenosyl methionine domain-containing protein 2
MRPSSGRSIAVFDAFTFPTAVHIVVAYIKRPFLMLQSPVAKMRKEPDMYKELSVNFHLTARCNMACRYCFNHRHDTQCATSEQQQEIVARLCHYGFSKISFVGGEPTLVPHLTDLLRLCKSMGKTTMLITNGGLLHQQRDCLAHCDWVGLSVDSLSAKTNALIGRNLPASTTYRQIVELIHNAGCKLKINTVVSRLNKDEGMHRFMDFSRPQRWKVLQVTKVQGQNEANFQNFAVSKGEFLSFVKRHVKFKGIIVPECSEDMIDSYLMLDHAGCFMSNSKHIYQKSPSILDVDVQAALEFVNFNHAKHINRNAKYDWS